MENSIIKHANENFKRVIAPLALGNYDKKIYHRKQGHKGTIIGYWAEDGNEFEISCPDQLCDSLIELLNNCHLLEFKNGI